MTDLPHDLLKRLVVAVEKIAGIEPLPTPIDPHVYFGLLRPRYQPYCNQIVAILERCGDDRKAIAKELKQAKIISEATYERDVCFYIPILRAMGYERDKATA